MISLSTSNIFNIKSITSAVLVSMLALSGCSKSETGDKSVSVEKTTETEESSEKDVDPSQKLEAYISCSNGSAQDFQSSFNRYNQWVKDLKVGPTGKEPVVYGLYDLNESYVEECTNGGVAATKLEPSLPKLDKAVTAYAAALTAYDNVSRKASAYYEQGNYKDDDLALGKELHPEIVKTYKALNTASKEFDKQLSVINIEHRTQKLAQVEKTEGKKFNYWVLATSMTAESMLNLINQEEFDTDKATALIKAYEDSSNGLIKYIGSKAEDVPMVASISESSMKQLLVSAKNRMRHVRDNEKYSQGDIMNINNGNGWMVEGSPDSVIKDYNAYIDSMNRL